MEIVLIRHTTPNIKKGICYGQSDIDVADSFLDEAEKILKKTTDLDYDIVYSSPLKRCKKLARKINSSIITDDRLKELNFGDWELKSWDDIYKEDLNNWMNNFVEVPTKNGESYIDLHKRSTDFINEISKLPYKRVIIVTHAGVIRSIWSYIHNIPLKNSFELKVNYGEILTVTI